MKQDTSNMKVGEKVGKRKIRVLFIYGRENQTSGGHCQTKSEFSNHSLMRCPMGRPKGYRPVNSEIPSWGGGRSSKALKHVTLSKINMPNIIHF